jgi:DNA-binding NarL/FixJ family response regulator
LAHVTIVAALPSVRFGLAEMLSSHGHTVVAEDDPTEATGTVWLLDEPNAPSLDALTAHRYSDSPRAAVVLSDEPGMANLLARAGLRGWACLARDADADQLDLAVRSAEAGLVLLDLPLAATSLAVPATVAAAQAMEPLTARELQVLQLVAQGLPNKGIARRLGISENTAKFHVASLCGKLGASSRTEAVTLAARRGLILL